MKESYKSRMDKALESLSHDLAGIRTGRANANILDSVRVESYGTLAPIRQVATISVSDSKTIVVQAFDKTLVGEIEKAILKADLGFNPHHDGTVIRIPIPELTKERREELKKGVRHRGEEARVAIRNIRRDENEHTKHELKEKNISEDEAKTLDKKVQQDTDGYIKRIDEFVSNKEKELDKI